MKKYLGDRIFRLYPPQIFFEVIHKISVAGIAVSFILCEFRSREHILSTILFSSAIALSFVFIMYNRHNIYYTVSPDYIRAFAMGGSFTIYFKDIERIYLEKCKIGTKHNQAYEVHIRMVEDGESVTYDMGLIKDADELLVQYEWWKRRNEYKHHMSNVAITFDNLEKGVKTDGR